MTSAELSQAIESFGTQLGYLAAASNGIPPRQAREALTSDLAAWSAGERDPQSYDGVVDRSRASFASIVGVEPSRVAIGSQTSAMISVVAASVPAGAEVLCVDGDFSSVIFPFLQSGATVRVVPLSELAGAITDNTWLVAFSLVQSSSGAVADVPAIIQSAAEHDSFTLCDTTQAAGVLPVDAALFDVTVCHAYKWLCSPRGVAFLTVSERIQSLLTPIQAGWYSGDQVWQSCYGPTMNLASDARQFDVSPAWQAWVGAEQSLALFAGLDVAEVWTMTSGLGDSLCDALGIPQQHQSIVSWPDVSGSDLEKLKAAGIRASGRAGRLRAAFHLWNTEDDVAAVVAALRH